MKVYLLAPKEEDEDPRKRLKLAHDAMVAWMKAANKAKQTNSPFWDYFLRESKRYCEQYFLMVEEHMKNV